MVAEHGSSSTMAMNNFIASINDLESAINPQDAVPQKIVELFKFINAGFEVFHRQVTDISDRVGADDIKTKIGSLDVVTQQINTNLHSLANQLQQHQSAASQQQQQHHRKGIL